MGMEFKLQLAATVLQVLSRRIAPEKGMEFKLQLAAFDFRADQDGKLKLELHAFFILSRRGNAT